MNEVDLCYITKALKKFPLKYAEPGYGGTQMKFQLNFKYGLKALFKPKRYSIKILFD